MRTKKAVHVSLSLALAGVFLTGCFDKKGETQVDGNAEARTKSATDLHAEAVVAAADAFVESLDAVGRQKVQMAYLPEKVATSARFAGGMNGRMMFVGEKYGEAVWSNFPVSDVPRPGVQMGSLTETQRSAAMTLLRALLSEKGYQKVIEIMGADEVLSEGGTNYASGSAYYTLGIFGTPSVTAPWMVEFGGHHLGLNITMASGRGAVMTPTLTGAQPALYTLNGKTVRPLAGENDKAYVLLSALDAAQRKAAILNYRVSDLVSGPGRDGAVIQPEGLKGSEMNEQQRAMLLDVISEWAGIMNEVDAGPRLAEIRAGLDETYFAWSGATTHAPGRNGSAYYRIQGPKVMIEFSPQGVGGDPTMHVHTMYRDPTNDYGREWVKP